MLKQSARKNQRQPVQPSLEEYQFSQNVWKKLAETHPEGTPGHALARDMVRMLQDTRLEAEELGGLDKKARSRITPGGQGFSENRRGGRQRDCIIKSQARRV